MNVKIADPGRKVYVVTQENAADIARQCGWTILDRQCNEPLTPLPGTVAAPKPVVHDPIFESKATPSPVGPIESVDPVSALPAVTDGVNATLRPAIAAHQTTVTVYAPDGGSAVVSRANAHDLTRLGWSLTPPGVIA